MAKEIMNEPVQEVLPFTKKDVEALERSTKRLKEFLLTGKKAIYNIALTLSKVDANKLYVAGGFKSVYEYAEKELDLGRATVNNYIRVANRFLETNAGGYATITLNNSAKEIDAKAEYPITTLTELLVLDDDKVKQITDDGEIDSTMNQKQVRAVVAQYKPKKEKKQKEETSETDDEQMEMELEEPASETFDSELLEAFAGIKAIAEETENEELENLLQIVMNKTGYKF